MNKGIIGYIFTTVLFAVVLFGCAKEEVKVLPPFDKKTAVEDSAILVIPANAAVTRIDGKKRGLFRSWSSSSKATTVLVPAGEHSIIFKYSHPDEGWAASKMKLQSDMDAGMMYLLSVKLDGKEKGGTFSTALNIAASRVRDDVINEYFPLADLLPRSNPEGVIYRISEIDQEAFDLYLLEGDKKIPLSIDLLSILLNVLWVVIILGILRMLWYFIFMGKFHNKHPVISLIVSIGLISIGIIIFNYNGGGVLYIYLLSTLIIGMGASVVDLGGEDNKRGLAALKGESVESTGNASADLEELVEALSTRKIENTYDKAVYYFTKAVTWAPYTSSYISNRGIAYCHLQEWGKAILDFTKAIQLKPKNADYYFNNRGDAYCHLQEWEKAIADYSKAIQLKPKNAVYIFNRGFIYYKLQDWKKSVADYSVAIQLEPENAKYINNRGLAYYNLQDWGNAITDFSNAMRLEPKNAVYIANHGDVYSNLKDWGNAIADFSNAIRIEPKNANYIYKRANAYYNLQDWKNVIADYTVAAQLEPNNAVYFNGRGNAYYHLQNWEKAIADYTDAVRIEPDNDTYKKNLIGAQNQVLKLNAKIVGVIHNQTEFDQFMIEYPQKLASEGYQELDRMGQKASELYQAFAKLPITMNAGEIYEYTLAPYKLLISRGELGVMISFIKKSDNTERTG